MESMLEIMSKVATTTITVLLHSRLLMMLDLVAGSPQLLLANHAQGSTNSARQVQTRSTNFIVAPDTSKNLVAQLSPSSTPNQVDSTSSPYNMETDPSARGDAINDVAPKAPKHQLTEQVGPDEVEAKQSQGPMTSILLNCSL